MANELKGYFVYSKTPKGNFNFRLKASNKETIAVSEGIYTTLSSCKSGIESVRKFGAHLPTLAIPFLQDALLA